MADTQDMKLHKLEGVKAASHQLRGSIGEELKNDADHFEGDTAQLLKFHGTYQQDDRDLRNRKDEQGNRQGKVYSCMIRTGVPGGRASAKQFLTELDLADKLGNGTLRLTTRQAFQLHGIVKGDLHQALHEINKAKMTSLSACGDVNRNVMANPVPIKNNPVIASLQEMADAISAHLKPKSTAYYDLWVKDEHGEKVEIEDFQPVEEPIYGKTYLPRKFKIGIALPEDNHTDIYTQDIGLLGIVENDEVVGYNISVGGGMGRTPSAKKTFPALGQTMAFLTPDQVVGVCEAVVKVQRDFGNREDRKVARMKYLVADWGVEKFKAKVEEYYGQPLAAPKDARVTGVDDHMGWREQGDGKLFLGLNIENGRIKDEGDFRLKTALRTVLEKYGMETRLTALQSLILCDIDPAHKEEITSIFTSHGIKMPEDYTITRRFSMACPAMPLCGLAVAESERIMPDFMTQLEAEMEKLELSEELISVHMTGCPNGCARPYTPDIGLVGKTLGKYTIFLGGNAIGTRLGFIYKDVVPEADLIPTLAPLLAFFKEARQEGETFGDFCDRQGMEGLEARVAA